MFFKNVSSLQFNIIVTHYCKVKNLTNKLLVNLVKQHFENATGKNFDFSKTSLSSFKNHGDKMSQYKADKIFNFLFEDLNKETEDLELKKYLDDEANAIQELRLKVKGIEANDSKNLEFKNSVTYFYLRSLFKAEEKEVLIITTWFSEIYRDIVKGIRIQDIDKDINIRILLLHPNSSIALERSRGLGVEDENGRKNIIINLKDISKHLSDHPNIHIKLYDQLPTFYGYIFSNRILCNWFFLNTYADQENFLSIKYDEQSKSNAQPFIDHFNKLWELESSELFVPNELESTLEKWNSKVSLDRLGKYGDSNSDLDHFMGHWSMYYPTKYPNIEIDSTNKYENDIGINIIRIYKNHHGVYCCSMKYHDEKQPEYHGIINLGLSSSSFISLTLFSPNHNKVLYIILNENNFSKNTYLGTYNVIYKRSNSESGSAITVFERISSTNIPEPCVVQIAGNKNRERITNDFILNYLVRGTDSLLPKISFNNDKAIRLKYEDCKYAGFYKIYGYGRVQNKDICISISTIEISKSGFVAFNKSRSDANYKTFGFVNKPDEALRIHLEDEISKRTGMMTIYVSQHQPKPGLFYIGTFSGVAFGTHIPVASRFVMEFISKEKPSNFEVEKIPLLEAKQKGVYEEIIELLSGRFDNFITFRNGTNIFNLPGLTKENQLSIDNSRLFLENAKYNLMTEKGDYKHGLLMLDRAIKHGLTKEGFLQFQQEIVNFVHYHHVKKNKMYLSMCDKFNDEKT